MPSKDLGLLLKIAVVVIIAAFMVAVLVGAGIRPIYVPAVQHNGTAYINGVEMTFTINGTEYFTIAGLVGKAGCSYSIFRVENGIASTPLPENSSTSAANFFPRRINCTLVTR
ncbi:MAG: hypothetical protein KGH98_01270 [Candidatus Micrarchaeota archaeon]|nr:hypothetical protein [Candidatus Micrarchaeota archaeon]